MTTKNLGTLISKLTRETIGVTFLPICSEPPPRQQPPSTAANFPHLASALLGHRDPRVAEEHYDRATRLEAGDTSVRHRPDLPVGLKNLAE